MSDEPHGGVSGRLLGGIVLAVGSVWIYQALPASWCRAVASTAYRLLSP